ncbi:MAG: hypothetical protein A2Y62_03275 [Candidatus Fischerbacteria bacterium RBG_13_37_8]|uniref:Thoeris protein ThsB TIR-like domain-containing protein n=1 Tax=Candidatus Fischerbacteria bacterium RBG_13_37_8 TaxID=1817863 RepID=A0A1F5VV66_9BACT|nr:MAG: hypothetical protein A2Y62_03275 [Candidatus Fischerbacteria bacterium RBG_13_37_8]
MPAHLQSQINSSNYVISIITHNGKHGKWVDKEIAFGSQKNKQILFLADADITINQRYQVIRIDRSDPFKTLVSVSEKIQRAISDKAAENLIEGLAIGAIILLILSSIKDK